MFQKCNKEQKLDLLKLYLGLQYYLMYKIYT